MTRQKMALLAASALAAMAVALGLAAIWAPALAGPAIVLAVPAGALVALALLAQLRAERRHRWALQKRLAELQHALDPTEQADHAAPPAGRPEDPAASGQSPPAASADYAALAQIHDRLHALESTLGNRP